jgi:polysaccharide biosynthesis protein PslH
MEELLFITPCVPNKNGSGTEKRVHQWLSRLKEHHHIHLLVVYPEKQRDDLFVAPVYFQLASCHVLYVRRARRNLRDLMKGFFYYALFCCGMQKDRVQGQLEIQESQKASLYNWYSKINLTRIFCMRLYHCKIAFYIRDITHVSHMELDMDDFESNTWAKLAWLYGHHFMWSSAKKTAMQAILFYFCEKIASPSFQRIYICSQEDQRKLERRLNRREIAVFPNRISLAEPIIQASSRQRQPYRIFFVGALAYFPNEDAVRWFVENCLPHLRKTGKPWEFFVAGFRAPAKLAAWLREHEGVIFLGEVDDLRPIYAESGSVVAPLRTGGGTKLKVIEAMLYGCPVVASSEAAYGLELIPEEHYLPADTAAEYVAQLLKLAGNSQLSDQIAHNARKYIEEKYVYQ